ncbi:isopropylmalate isomerase, partial [Nitrosococcus oceani]
NNCFKNGVLPIRVSDDILQKLFSIKSEIEVDLETQSIKADGIQVSFHIEPHWKKILLEGLDDIAVTLLHESEIVRYEKSHKT